MSTIGTGPMFPDLEKQIHGEKPNIVLEYPLRIERTVDSSGSVDALFTDRGEFFVDEHGLQWVKFVAKNGYAKGKEHMIRTDALGFAVIRDEVRS